MALKRPGPSSASAVTAMKVVYGTPSIAQRFAIDWLIVAVLTVKPSGLFGSRKVERV